MQQQTLTNQYLYNYAALCASDAPFLAQLHRVRYRKMFIHSCDVRILLPIALMMDK